jgi:hypothetical protein
VCPRSEYFSTNPTFWLVAEEEEEEEEDNEGNPKLDAHWPQPLKTKNEIWQNKMFL